jgi:hypothetical protein
MDRSFSVRTINHPRYAERYNLLFFFLVVIYVANMHPWVNVDHMLDACMVGFLVPDSMS